VQSHIGKTLIEIPPTVTLTDTKKGLEIAGPLGSTIIPIDPFMQFTYGEMTPPDEGTSGATAGPPIRTLLVTPENPKVKKQKQMWGTTRTHIANAITGMTVGFTIPLYLVGVGFRAALEKDPRGEELGNSGMQIAMKVGHTHFVYVPIPIGIEAEVPSPTKIVLKCTDKQKIGQFAAVVRAFRKPEPYKGKVRAHKLSLIYIG
jgi:large subunit ribosomal protein L6